MIGTHRVEVPVEGSLPAERGRSVVLGVFR